MEAEVVEKIANLQASIDAPVSVDGEIWSKKSLIPIVYDPQPEPFNVGTLKAVIDFVNSMKPEEKAGAFIVIDGVGSVSIESDIRARTQKRRNFLNSKAISRNAFSFGNWMEIESFLISIRAAFKETPSRQALLNFTSKITHGSTVTLQDDGVGQEVTVKQGVSGALKANEVAPAIVLLQPYRTFREVEQPKSEFIFRIKSEGEKIRCALFEADGGAWEIEAISNVASYLAEKVEGIKIIS